MKLFENIQVQTCSWCNLKCKFCPNSYLDRPREAMDMAVYDRIIQELRDINFSGRFSPFLMNEPLLDNRLPALVHRARTALPKAHICIDTNGTLLTKEKLALLVDAGMNMIYVNCYSGKGQFDKLSKMVNEIGVGEGLVSLRIIDGETIGGFYNRGGNIQIPTSLRNNKKLNLIKPFVRQLKRRIKYHVLDYKYCDQPFVQMFINYKGDVVLCCSDYKYEVVIGNILEDSIVDIWFNEKLAHYRKMLLAGKRNKLPLCKECDLFVRKNIVLPYCKDN